MEISGLHQPARWLRIITPVVNSEKAITSRKKMTFRESINPFENGSKCVITLNDDTRLTSHGLSMRLKKFVTGANPHRTSNKHITAEMMKLTTWLRVIAEVMQLMAR